MKIFASVFIKNIGLLFSILVVSLSGFGFSVLASEYLKEDLSFLDILEKLEEYKVLNLL